MLGGFAVKPGRFGDRVGDALEHAVRSLDDFTAIMKIL